MESLSILLFVLLFTKRVKAVGKSCDTLNDCGLGGSCSAVPNSDKGVCDCSISDMLFTSDEDGNCNKLVKNYCDTYPPRFNAPNYKFPESLTKGLLCSHKPPVSNCTNTFGSFCCLCEDFCKLRFCEHCEKGIGLRSGTPYFAYEVKGYPLKVRKILICFAYILGSMRAYLVLFRSVPTFRDVPVEVVMHWTEDDFVMTDAYNICVEMEIDPIICSYIPVSEKFPCTSHKVILPYTDYMGQDKPPAEKIFYEMTFDSGSAVPNEEFNTRTNIRDFFIQTTFAFYSDFFDENYMCCPLIDLVNILMDNNLRDTQNQKITLNHLDCLRKLPPGNSLAFYHISNSFTARMNVTLSTKCPYTVVHIFFQWHLYHVTDSFDSTVATRPVRREDQIPFFVFDRYEIQMDSFYRLEMWVDFKIKENNQLMTYRNFQFGLYLAKFWVINPIIKGGNFRTVPANEMVVADGSASFDPHYSPYDQRHLFYRWSCDYDCIECIVKQTEASVYHINRKFPVGTLLNVTVVLHDTRRSYFSGSYSQLIKFVEEDIPIVYITCKRNCGVYGVPASPNTAVFLVASIGDGSIVSEDWEWSCVRQVVEDGKIVQNITVDLSKLRVKGHYNRHLVFTPEHTHHSHRETFIDKYIVSVSGGGNPPGQAKFTLDVRTATNKNRLHLVIESANKDQTHFRIMAYFGRRTNVATIRYMQLYFDFYQKSDNASEPMILFAFNIEGLLNYAPLIYGSIIVKVCDAIGKCEVIKGKVKLKKPSTELVNEMAEHVFIFLYKWFRVDDAIMNAIFCIHYVDELKQDKIEFLENVMNAIETLPVYFPRDIKHLSSVYFQAFRKREELYDLRPVNITRLVTGVNYLRKLASAVRKDSHYIFPVQTEYDKSTFVEVAEYIMGCIQILIEWRERLILSTDDPDVILDCRGMSTPMIQTFEDVAIMCGRRLYNREGAIEFNYSRLQFWLKADDMYLFSKGADYSNTSDATIMIPKELADILHHLSYTFVINLVVLSTDPYGWNKQLLNYNRHFSSILHLTVLRISEDGFVYTAHTIHGHQRYPFQLTFQHNAAQYSEAVKGSVSRPSENLDEDGREAALLIYKLNHQEMNFVRFSFNFTYIDESGEIIIVHCKNMLPDYNYMIEHSDSTINNEKSKFYFDSSYKENDIEYVGILWKAGSKNVSFEVEASMFACLRWHGYAWHSKNCNVTFANETEIRCDCDHFSPFTSFSSVARLFLVRHQIQRFILIFPKNWWNLLPIILLLLLFLLLFPLFIYLDIKDKLYHYAIVLEDNIPGDRYPYLLVVRTGHRISCGTTATVGFQVHGSDGFSSRKHILKCTWRPVLKEGSDDWFIFFTERSLGSIEAIEIWQDFSGISPSWYCRNISIFDLYTRIEYVFIVEAWLTVLLKEDANLHYLRKTASNRMIYNPDRLARNNIIYALRDGHLLIGTICKHPRSNLYRCERFALLYLMILLLMVFAMYFHKILENPKGYFFDLKFFSISLYDLQIGLYCIAIVIPIIFILSYCFRRGKVLPQKRLLSEMDYHQSYSYLAIVRSVEKLGERKFISRKIAPYFMLQPFQPIIVSHDRNAYLITRRSSMRSHILPWVIVSALLIILNIVIIFYIIHVPDKILMKLSASVLFGIFLDVLIIQPIVLIVCGFILAYCFKVAQRISNFEVFDRDQLEAYNDNLIGDAAYSENLMERRGQHCYDPLAPKKDLTIRSVAHSHWNRKWAAFDLGVDMVYFLGFFILLSNLQIFNRTITARQIEHSLTSPFNKTPGFYDVTTPEMWYDYINHNLFPRMYSAIVKSKTTQGFKTYFGVDHGGYFPWLVGIPRIRQQRVKMGTCVLPDDTNDLINECSDTLSFSNEDTSDIDPLDRKAFLNVHVNSSSTIDYSEFDDTKHRWKYLSDRHSKTLGVHGKSGNFYRGGGYTVNLSRDLFDSLLIMRELENDYWIDEWTRVIIIEFLLYNVDSNILTAIVMVSENFANGVFLNKVLSHPMVLTSQFRGITFFLLFLILFVVLAIMCSRAVYLMQLYGCEKFFRTVPHVLYFIALMLGLFALFCWLVQLIQDSLHLTILHESLITSDFLNFYEPVYRENFRNIFIGLFTLFIILRVIYYVHIGRNFVAFTYTLLYVVESALFLCLIAIFFIMIVSVLASLVQNPIVPFKFLMLPGYRDFSQLTKQMFSPEKLVFPVLICFISAVLFIASRLFVLFFYACSQSNITRNYFLRELRWRLNNFVPYELQDLKNQVRFRGGADVIGNLRNFKFSDRTKEQPVSMRLIQIQTVTLDVLSDFLKKDS